MRQLFLCAVLVGALSAGAEAQAAPRAARPASDTVKFGKYDLELTSDDGTLTGWLTVKREHDKLIAVVNAGGHSPAVQSFVRDGAGYTLTGGHEDFKVVYKFKFDRDSVSGSYSVSSGQAGKVTGAFKP